GRAARGAAVAAMVAIEAHLESLVQTAQAAVALLGRTPGLTVTLDYTHFTCQGIPDSRIEPLIRHASHFHARGAAAQGLQMPLKQNVIDYPRVVQTMAREGYRGFVGVEYCWDEWRQCNEVDVLSETILMRDLL